MNKILTINDMIESAKKFHGKVLSEKYINSQTKLLWICANNHIFYATPNSVRMGHWCPTCARGRQSLGEFISREILEKMFNIRFIKSRPNFLKTLNHARGLELDGYNEQLKIAFEYHGEQHYKSVNLFGGENQLKKQKYIDSLKINLCEENNIKLIIIHKFSNTNNLKECISSIENSVRNSGLKIPRNWIAPEKIEGFRKNLVMIFGSSRLENLNRIVKLNEGNLLSCDAVNTTTLLNWECKEGHRWDAKAGAIEKGSWCKICSIVSVGIKRRLSRNAGQILAESKGGKFLSNSYIKSQNIYKWECAYGHVWETTYNSIAARNTWCPYCSGNNKKTIEDMIILANSKNGYFLSKKYMGANANHQWRCNNNHIFLKTPSWVIGGRWCNQCKKG